MKQPTFDVIIIGAGAAGLMCAIEDGKRGRRVLVLDHANKVGKKILMSGGGRCNFTNYYIDPTRYISHNPHFLKSALSRYTQWDFIELVKKHKIPFYEKTLGQLFCVNKSKDIVAMLLAECDDAGVTVQINTSIENIKKINSSGFELKTSQGKLSTQSLVIATGALSIPTLGATPFAYHIAEQFGLKVWPTRPGLVPFTLDPRDKEKLTPLSGIALDSVVQYKHIEFKEGLLFTHRGLSGPVILQISSYYQPGEPISINLLPEVNLLETLKAARSSTPKKQLNSVLTTHLPKRVAEIFTPEHLATKNLADLANQDLETIANTINNWCIKQNGT